MKRLGITLQTGVQTVEFDFIDEQANGVAVEMAELTARRCQSGEIVVTNTVKDLVVGSGLVFSSQEAIEIPGNPGQQLLHRVVR